MTGSAARESKTPFAYCPHCGSLLATAAGPAATRCGSCRLIIGPGRAISAELAGQISSVSSAGTRANSAKRAAAAPADPERVLEAIRTVADRRGEPLARLRMIDYA